MCMVVAVTPDEPPSAVEPEHVIAYFVVPPGGSTQLYLGISLESEAVILSALLWSVGVEQ